MANQSQRGGSYERKLCKKLSLWITGGQRSDVLWRTAMSGGQRKASRGKTRDQAADKGDVTAVQPEGTLLTELFCIEAKWRKNIGLETCLFTPAAKSAVLVQCWNQTAEAARMSTANLRNLGQRDALRLPMLCIMVYNRRELMLVTEPGIDILENANGFHEVQPQMVFPQLDWAYAYFLDEVLMTDFQGIRNAYGGGR